jgi:hypothetical protein
VFCSNSQTGKKKCADCIVRMDDDMADSYDTWQVLVGSWMMNRFLTCGLFVANGMVTCGPINGCHVSPGQWFKTYEVDRTRPRDLRGKGKSFGKGCPTSMPTYDS